MSLKETLIILNAWSDMFKYGPEYSLLVLQQLYE
jgi:hypothetical protein